MRILQVHNRYSRSGGEDVVVKSESLILKKNNNHVYLFEVNNESIKGTKAKIKVALNVSYSSRYNKELSKVFKGFMPDIVHVHNFYPLITPSIYDVCKSFKVPVIQTLHNYRIICPGALLMRNGRICVECLSRSVYKAAFYRCYRDSTIGSLFVANMVHFNRKRKTWWEKVDQFIALTDFSREMFIKGGLPSSRIQIKPNFVFPDPGIGNFNGKYALYVGRISKEKGIITLLRAWEKVQRFSIKIIGDGPMIEDLYRFKKSRDLSNIEILGQLSREKIFQFMKNALFIIFPSEWYETFGLICAEAFACGKPVIASRIGSMIDIVEDGVTGLHFEPKNSNDLADKIQWLLYNSNDCQRMGENARKVFLDKYTADENYKILMNIYKKALSQN